jgi:fructokinase
MHQIFTLGESVLDIIFEDGSVVASTPGGAMLNTAVSLGRLGCNVFHISEISNDLCGNLILNFLRENNVHTDFMALHETGKTTVAMAFLDERKEAEYDFYRSEPLLPYPISMPKFTAGDLLLFGSFYSLDAKNRDKVLNIISTAKKNGTLILYDPNIRKAHCPLSKEEKEWFLENISLSDMVRGSNEDFSNVFETENITTIYDIVRQQGCRHLFLTKGAKGAFYKNDMLELHVAAKPLQPISSIGAGDTFNAGILYGISQLLSYSFPLDNLLNTNAEEIMKTAIEMASEVCMSRGNYITV